MDARMQKHRIIRWMGRLLVVLSLVAPWGVQAVSLETVPATVRWCNGLVAVKYTSFFSVDTPGCSYQTVISAAKAYAITWNADLKAKNMNVQVSINNCVSYVNYGWENRCYYYGYGANDPDPGPFPNNNNMNFFDVEGVWSCPDPTIDPSSPYIIHDFKFVDASTPTTASCSRVAKNSLTLTLSGGTEVEPSNGSDKKFLPIIATVIDQSTNQPPTNPVKVHVSLKVEDLKSGGHDHGDSTRPRGGIAEVKTCASDGECWPGPQSTNGKGMTDGNGQVVFNFNAPEASGKYTITAICDGCSSSSAPKTVEVKVDGLETIPNSTFYKFIGDTDKHTKNHYLMPEAATVLRNIAISYLIEDKFWQLKKARRGRTGQYTYTPPSVLNVNDASLIWGGKFDIHGKWNGDHQAHKRGIVVDIRANQININNGAIPLQSFTNFQKLAKSYDAKAQVHCSDDEQDRHPPDCIGDDGTQDDLRHFHVILIGGVDK